MELNKGNSIFICTVINMTMPANLQQFGFIKDNKSAENLGIRI